jgi:hypothetical protein
MCTNQREIVNKYTGHKLYVKCGHCPACLQEKAAHRVSRIRAQNSDATETYMLTLTYRNECVPYVRRDDAYLFSRNKYGLCCDYPAEPDYNGNRSIVLRSYNLPVYRDMDYRWIRSSSVYDMSIKELGRKVLTTVGYKKQVDFNNLKDLNGKPNCIGVCYYPDLQHFVAKLRQNLKRFFQVDYEFKTYCCSEYGTKRQRPHFHLLLWIPKGTAETFRSAIIKSWLYGDIQNHPRRFERAFRASSYVASYVNKPSDFPHFLTTYFDCSHSYSKGFGLCSNDFSLSSILSKFHRGHLTRFVRKDKSGSAKYIEQPLPSYVIYRYFPLFKGYNRIAPSSLHSVTKRLVDADFCSLSIGEGIQIEPTKGMLIWYSKDDIHKISVRLRNAFERFNERMVDTPFSFDDYLILHRGIWSLYHSDVLRLHLENNDISTQEKYDNLEEIKIKYNRAIENHITPILPYGFTYDMLRITNPNQFSSVIYNSGIFARSFHDNIKHRLVNEVTVLSEDSEF